VANGSHGPGALVRKIFAGALGAVAAFVILFGAGLQVWTIMALGAAMLILAIGLVAFPAMRSGGRAWVAGSAHVVSASEPPASSTYGRCELQIVIDAPGLPAAAVKVRDPRVPVAKWPDARTTLPIMVAMDDPRHVRIQWDDVLTHAEAAAQEHLHTFDDTQTDLPVQRGDDIGLHASERRVMADNDPDLRGGTLDLADDVERIADEERAGERVIVTHTPAGTIVEGTVVDRPAGGPRDVPAAAPTGDAPTGDAPAAEAPTGERPAGQGGGSGIPPQRKPRPHPPRDQSAQGPASAGAADTADAADTAGAAGATDTAGATGAATAAGATAAGVAAAGATATTATAANGSAGAATATDQAPESEQAAPTDGGDVADLITAYPSARPSPNAAIHGVGITVLVTDLERSIAFYRDMLGFFEIDGGEGNAVLASGDTRLVLRAIPDITKIKNRTVHVNLEVGDVDAMYEELKSKGVRFTYAPRPVSKGERLEQWAAAFRDPDGHGISITQWRNRPS